MQISKNQTLKNILDSRKVWLCHVLVFDLLQVNFSEPQFPCFWMKIENKYLPHKIVNKCQTKKSYESWKLFENFSVMN